MILCNILRATQCTNTGQVPVCSQQPVDSTDANIVETSTCLETTQQETTKSTVQLLVESCSAIDIRHSQLHRCLSVQSSYHNENTLRIRAMLSMLKSFQKQLQRSHKQPCLKMTLLRRLIFFRRSFYRFFTVNRKQCAGVILLNTRYRVPPLQSSGIAE